MSIVKESGEKVVLADVGLAQFWQLAADYYAGSSRRNWRALAMLALRECADWKLDMIQRAFHVNRGQISRMIDEAKSEIRERVKHAPVLRYVDSEDGLRRGGW